MIYYKVALTKMLEQVGLIIFVVVILKTDLATLIRIGLKWRTYQFNGLAFFWNVVSIRASSFSHIQITVRSIQYDIEVSRLWKTFRTCTYYIVYLQ